MKIWIDADGCPVVSAAISVAKRHDIPVTAVCDTSHVINQADDVIVVSKGADSVDYKIVNLVNKDDIVVTQDYGLAAMCLAREAYPINQNGLVYTADNIDSLLGIRAESAKYRRAGGRTKGPKKRTAQNDSDFENSLTELINKIR